MSFFLNRDILDDIAKLINLLDLPRHFPVAGGLKLIFVRDVRVRGQLGVNGRCGLHGRVRRRGLRDTERATDDAVDAHEESVGQAMSSSPLIRQKTSNSLVGVGDGEARPDERTIDKDSRHLTQLVFRLDIPFILFSGKLLDAA